MSAIIILILPTSIFFIKVFIYFIILRSVLFHCSHVEYVSCADEKRIQHLEERLHQLDAEKNTLEQQIAQLSTVCYSNGLHIYITYALSEYELRNIYILI